MTGTSLKNLKTAHCIVNLYKSVSRKEMTPSGNGDELLKSMVGDYEADSGELIARFACKSEAKGRLVGDLEAREPEDRRSGAGVGS